MWKGIVILTCGWLECSSWLIFINFQTELLVPRHGRWLSSVSFFFSLTFGNWTLLIVVIARTYSSLGYFWSFWRNRDWQKISLYTDRFLNWWHVDHVILYSSGCSIDFFLFFWQGTCVLLKIQLLSADPMFQILYWSLLVQQSIVSFSDVLSKYLFQRWHHLLLLLKLW